MNTVVNTPKAPGAIGPYSQAICTGTRLYTSGQLGVDAATGTLPDDFAAQAHLAMQNLGHVLEAAGFSFADVVKATVLLDDLANFTTLNEIYASYLPEIKPARTCYQVAALPKGAKVEIEMIAEKG